MWIVATKRVVQEYGERIRAVDPAARFIVPVVDGGELRWEGEPGFAEVCCFSEDSWQDMELRQRLIPALFRLERLKWFHTFSAGVDSPAFQVIIDRGTILTNSSGASAPSIAQYVLAMMLYCSKPIETWREQQRRHAWAPAPGGDLTAKTAGIIGTGAIGGEVARLAKAFNMRTVGMRRSARSTRYVDEQVSPAQLERLLAQSDFVVLACPLTKQTEGLIGERELRAMKPDAVLINVARGRVVDEAALVRALEERRIGGACLDVFATEPLPEDSPLWDMPNVVVTPHNSAVSPLNMDRAMAIFVDNLGRLVSGKPLRNRVLRAGVTE
jgi:phosphoglycerate dehydrogenase-like enzyme